MICPGEVPLAVRVELPERGVHARVRGGDPNILPAEMPDTVLGTGFGLITGALEVHTLGIDPAATPVGYDRVLFHTVPAGQRLRVRSLPAAWRDVIDTDPPGLAHVGPLSALLAQDDRTHPAASTVLNRGRSLIDRLDTVPERAAAEVLTVLSHGPGACVCVEADLVAWGQGRTARLRAPSGGTCAAGDAPVPPLLRAGGSLAARGGARTRRSQEGILPATRGRAGTTVLATARVPASTRPGDQVLLPLVDPAPRCVLVVGRLRRPRRVSLSCRVDHPRNDAVTGQPAEVSVLVRPW